MTPINVDGSILKMKAFPFSLIDKAKDWLYELAPGTVIFWESMKRAFLEKFFPTSRVILLRKKISGIQQNQGESFPAYYERFKTLVASCPQYQMKEELLIQFFYEGLLPLKRQMLDASTGGALVDKTPVTAKILIANGALNTQQYEGVGGKEPPRQQHVNEFREEGKLPSSTIVNPKGGFETSKAITLRSGKKVGIKPNTSKSSKKEDNKLLLEEEELDKATARKESSLPQPPNAPKPSNSADRSNAYPKGVLEDVLVQDYLDSLNEDALETTIAQGIRLQNEGADVKHPHGMAREILAVPPSAEIEWLLPLSHCDNILRQMLDASAGGALVDKTLVATKILIANRALNAQQYEGVGQRDPPRQQQVNERMEDGKVPMSWAIKAKINHGMIHTLIPTIWAGDMIQISSGESLNNPNNKEDIDSHLPGSIKSHSYHHNFQHNLPNQIQGQQNQAKEMSEVKKQIGQMAEFFGQFREEGELKNTGVIIQLADRANAYSKGILKDVLVQVDHLIFPADFYVLEMEYSAHSPSLPLLLGRPFMKTAQTKIDMAK
ncbi:uncharacterized protein [Malus domestica]|uniref:uncharacterized protein n=1 Tax=Malus domestica TaxID=3750 RepID=UPI00397499A0